MSQAQGTSAAVDVAVLEHLDFEPSDEPSQLCEARAALLDTAGKIIGSTPCERQAALLVQAGPCRKCGRGGRRFLICNECWASGVVVACRYCSTQWPRGDHWTILATLSSGT